MDWKLELVPVPVADVERAKRFYSEQLGFDVDHDVSVGGRARIVQLTPPGSECSIVIGAGAGVTEVPPGSVQGLQLVVSDVAAARAQLVERGVAASPVQHVEDGALADGPGGTWNSFVYFTDPDGNGWSLQEGPEGDG
ncbi:glyoxalase [Streptomyces nigrescens]|uniref:Glyoxalase n=2 Tax=Streptomyces TaxID=1883 RepID=A0ABM8A2T9_STRNI|nr:VOC family protein [Streptomyces nigrescens]MEE4424391.1 VOC family protein [Streptomyces sp. DSM 41528]BDM72975.1 glyoxalase [Streptomyces nigrescens]